MSVRTRQVAGHQVWYESATDETLLAVVPFWFKDDFLATGLAAHWGSQTTGGGAVTIVNDANGGAVALQLTSTNEVQLKGINGNDNRILVLNQRLVFEARVKFQVLPTGAVVAVIGLCSDHNAAVNSVASSIWFRVDGNGVITVEADDTVHETSQVATGVTVVAGQEVTLRIECDVISKIRFYINGQRVAAGTTFDMSQTPAVALQPVLRIGKESASTAVGELRADYVTAFQSRAG